MVKKKLLGSPPKEGLVEEKGHRSLYREVLDTWQGCKEFGKEVSSFLKPFFHQKKQENEEK